MSVLRAIRRERTRRRASLSKQRRSRPRGGRTPFQMEALEPRILLSGSGGGIDLAVENVEAVELGFEHFDNWMQLVEDYDLLGQDIPVLGTSIGEALSFAGGIAGDLSSLAAWLSDEITTNGSVNSTDLATTLDSYDSFTATDNSSAGELSLGMELVLSGTLPTPQLDLGDEWATTLGDSVTTVTVDMPVFDLIPSLTFAFDFTLDIGSGVTAIAPNAITAGIEATASGFGFGVDFEGCG